MIADHQSSSANRVRNATVSSYVVRQQSRFSFDEGDIFLNTRAVTEYEVLADILPGAARCEKGFEKGFAHSLVRSGAIEGDSGDSLLLDLIEFRNQQHGESHLF